MRDRGNCLVGRVAFLVVGPTTVGGKGRKSAIEGISESIEGKWQTERFTSNSHDPAQIEGVTLFYVSR